MNTILSKKLKLPKTRNYCNSQITKTKFLKYYGYAIVGGGIIGSLSFGFGEISTQETYEYNKYDEIIFGFVCGFAIGSATTIILPISIACVPPILLYDKLTKE